MKKILLILILLIGLNVFAYKDPYAYLEIESPDKEHVIKQIPKTIPWLGEPIRQLYIYVENIKTGKKILVAKTDFFGKRRPKLIGFKNNTAILFVQEEHIADDFWTIYEFSIKKKQKKYIYKDNHNERLREFFISPNGEYMVCNGKNNLKYINGKPVDFFNLYLLNLETHKLVLIENSIINEDLNTNEYIKWSPDSNSITYTKADYTKQTFNIAEINWDEAVS